MLLCLQNKFKNLKFPNNWFGLRGDGVKTELNGAVKRLKENKYLIFLMIVLSMICSLVVSSQFTTPEYEASAQLLIGGQWASDGALDKYMIQEDTKFLDTYQQIIFSPYILSKVKEKTGTSLSMNEIRKNLAMEFDENSQVFSISIKHENYREAVLLTNTAARIFIAETGGVMNANNLKLLDLASDEDEAAPVGMGNVAKLAVALFAGLFAGLGMAYILPELNTSINSNKDAEELLGVPVIGFISIIKNGEGTG